MKCSYCKAIVTNSKEKTCPFCGRKLHLSLDKGLLIIFAVVLLGAIILAVAAYDPTSSKNAPPPEVINSPWDASVQQVEAYLKENLKDPKSFEAIEWSPVAKLEKGGYMVRCKYRAKNSYGGYVIENKVFYMDARGNVLAALDHND